MEERKCAIIILAFRLLGYKWLVKRNECDDPASDRIDVFPCKPKKWGDIWWSGDYQMEFPYKEYSFEISKEVFKDFEADMPYYIGD